MSIACVLRVGDGRLRGELVSPDAVAMASLHNSDTIALAGAAARGRSDADAHWHQLTVSPDRDDATDTDRDPFAAHAAASHQ